MRNLRYAVRILIKSPVFAPPAMDDLYRMPELKARLQTIPLQRAVTEEVRPPVLVLWGAVAVVLLIGCVNIAGLQLARSVSRAPEFAIRMAVGGGRAAIDPITALRAS